MPDNIRLGHDDLYNPKVDMIIDQQKALQQIMPPTQEPPLWRKILFNSIFFLAVAGAIGGFIGWLIIEPNFSEGFSFYGEIEDISLADFGSGRVLNVKGIPVLVDEQATFITGRDGYAHIKEVSDLKVGMPVQAQVMKLGYYDIGDPMPLILGTRIRVRELTPEQLSTPAPSYTEKTTGENVMNIFAFAIIGVCIAGLIAAADGIMSRNFRRGLICAIVGIGIAAGGGLITLLPAGMVFSVFTTIVSSLAAPVWTSSSLSGFPLVVMILGRSFTWGIVGLTVGLGQGAALRSKKLFLNGLLGGVLGGLLGGIFFEPLIILFSRLEVPFLDDAGITAQATISRLFGFTIIGLSAGLMIGLVEQLAKNAWLLMRTGPLSGKQFIIYRNPTTIGSSPKSELYLFKDPDVEPRHALIHKVGNRHEIEDLHSPAGTFVNGQRVRRQNLRDGDQIMIGQTVLQYAERPETR